VTASTASIDLNNPPRDAYILDIVGEGEKRDLRARFGGQTVILPHADEFYEQIHSRSKCHIFWNVTTARNWIAGGQVQVATIDTPPWTIDDLLRQYPALDVVHAMETDLAKPLIVLEGAEAQGDLLIDGWHRLYKALRTGATEIVAGKIHRGWARKIMIGWLPPGCPMVHEAIEQKGVKL
jgi:hypothetical protein